MLDSLSDRTGPDDDRTRGQRQLDALLGALAARTGGVPLELQLGIPVQVTDTRPVPGCAPEPVAIAADLTPELLALLTTDTAPEPDTRPQPAGPAEVEAEVDPATHARAEADLATEADPTAADATAADAVADEQPRQASTADRATRPVRRDSVAELIDLGPVDPGLLASLLTDPAGLPAGIREVRIRRTCLDRTGQVVAVDQRTLPLQTLLAPGGAAGLLRRLIQGLPAPPPMTDAHDPTAAQTRVVRARDPRCTFPGCGRRARRSELDHRRPHPDGPTSVTNLHPLCAHHHHLKHDGWTCRRDPDGATTWTSPRGQRSVVGQR